MIKHLHKNLYIILTAILLSSVYSCKQSFKLYSITSDTYTIADSIDVDSTILKAIEPYKLSIDSTMNTIIGYSEKNMTNGVPESLLGNFVCDLTMKIIKDKYPSISDTNTFVVFNNGGFRSILPRGEIKLSDIYKVMPFENKIVILELDGKTTKKIIAEIAAKGGMPTSGIRLLLNADSIVSAKIGKLDFSINRTYNLVTSDYIANGGENIEGIDERLTLIDTDIKIRDAIIDHFIELSTKKKSADAKLDGRISYE